VRTVPEHASMEKALPTLPDTMEKSSEPGVEPGMDALATPTSTPAGCSSCTVAVEL
jgi:hypothetical protein